MSVAGGPAARAVRPPKPPRRPVDRTLLKRGAALAAAFFLAGYLFTWIVFFPGWGRDAIVAVPDLRGRPLVGAIRLADEQGLEMERGSSLAHPRVPRGSVLAQVPLPGAEVTRGSTVRVILSSGPERRKVPDIKGLGLDGAKALLTRFGFVPRTREVASMTPQGRILDSKPAAGTEAPVPSYVELTISAGPPKVLAPDVVGMDRETARTTLSVAGLRFGAVRWDSTSTAAEGTVLAQRPAAGDSIRSGGGVGVTLAGFPPPPPPEAAPDTLATSPAGEPTPAEPVPEPAPPPAQPAKESRP